MANTTYQVTLATDGRHSVTVSCDDPKETNVAVAWAKATYEALAERYGHIQFKDPKAEAGEPHAAPVWAVHDVPMVRMEGKRGPFWSCHQRTEDGSFCSYRPSTGG